MSLLICKIDVYTKTGVPMINLNCTKCGKPQWLLIYANVYCFDNGIHDNGDHVFWLSWSIVTNSYV